MFTRSSRSTLLHLALLATLLPAVSPGVCRADPSWPQFRGLNGAGVADQHPLPGDLQAAENLIWKRPIAKGHSSPVVVGGRIYLTALDKKRLLTIAMNAETGEQIWSDPAPFEKLESVHRIGSPATASVATDVAAVFSFFGSSGMSAHSLDGELKWRKRMGPFNNSFGACSSPILVGDRLISLQDHDTGSHLAAFDKSNGDLLWRVERPNFRRNYGTPVVWRTGEETQIVVAGTAQLMAYNVDDGELRWQVRGLCRVVSNTPVVGEDGSLYVASTGGGSAPPQPAFDQLILERDANKNGRLEAKELPNSPIKSFIDQFDRDANGGLDEEEYESIRTIFAQAKSEAMVIRPGGRGDITDSHVAWRDGGKSTPRNASPLIYRGRMYMVKDGGILTVLDAGDGKLLERVRIRGGGKFFSSPVAGDGKLYVCSDRGNVTVLAADDSLKQQSQIALAEDIYATPAIADGRVYVRTVSGLYCFGLPR
ncbi:MAG: PQQ-binding-like beta-propeller repeat protein [Pirellulaceae bacterium]|jgi:outer membrane protein assembly factor BamB|nr:PQQ-binding-like beta-propeller repeat protein [Pirellulaceae bacterium]